MGTALIRSASNADLAAVESLAAAWAEEGITLGQAPASVDWLASRLESYFVVAEVDRTIVGYCIGEAVTTDESVAAALPVGTPCVEISELYVDAKHRGNNIGAELLHAVLARAAEHGIERSMLFTSTRDVAGILRFYERHGFRGWGVQMLR